MAISLHMWSNYSTLNLNTDLFGLFHFAGRTNQSNGHCLQSVCSVFTSQPNSAILNDFSAEFQSTKRPLSFLLGLLDTGIEWRTLLRNVDNYLQVETLWQPKRPEPSSTQLREAQISHLRSVANEYTSRLIVRNKLTSLPRQTNYGIRRDKTTNNG